MIGAALVIDPAAAAEENPPAPPPVVREIESTLQRAVERLEARDTAGVLAFVSDQYRTGPFTKVGVREQLVALYGVYDVVKAKVHIDATQLAGETVWVYTTGQLSGRLRGIGTWIVVLTWRHELEVARREATGWRLYGYQR